MVRPSTSSLRRGLLHGLLVCLLLTGPLWVSELHLGEPASQYDRSAVVATDDGIEYVDEHRFPSSPPSAEIACSEWDRPLRSCAFERHLLEAGYVPSGAYASNPNVSPSGGSFREPDYDYVQLNGRVYEPTYVTNESAQREDGLYRIDVHLEPIAPETALERVSIDADSDHLPQIVAETARSGRTATHQDVDVPRTPIALDDGPYYRVYRSGETDEPSSFERTFAFVFTYVAPAIGLVSLAQFCWRIEVSYDDGRDG